MNQEMNNMVPGVEPKKKSKAPILIIGIVAVVIGVGLYLFFCTDLFKKEEPKNDSTPKQEEKKDDKKEEEVILFNGEYEKDGKTIILFQTSKEKVYMESDAADMPLDIKGSTIKGSSFDNEITIKVSDGKIEVTSTIEGLPSGTYTKTNEYTKEKYYEHHIGNSEYLTSKYNGIYKNGNKTVEIFQVEKDKVRVNAVSQDNNSYVGYEHEFTIEADGTLKENDGSTIKLTDKSLELNLKDESYGKALNGTYTKEKDITIDYIIENYN